jgi:hypothetical protein
MPHNAHTWHRASQLPHSRRRARKAFTNAAAYERGQGGAHQKSHGVTKDKRKFVLLMKLAKVLVTILKLRNTTSSQYACVVSNGITITITRPNSTSCQTWNRQLRRQQQLHASPSPPICQSCMSDWVPTGPIIVDIIIVTIN